MIYLNKGFSNLLDWYQNINHVLCLSIYSRRIDDTMCISLLHNNIIPVCHLNTQWTFHPCYQSYTLFKQNAIFLLHRLSPYFTGDYCRNRVFLPDAVYLIHQWQTKH
jgi:hypothetical protein